MSTRTADAPMASDARLAAEMGVSKSAVSLVVRGLRRPGVVFMTKVEATLGWSMRAQHLALADGEYAARFRRHIKQWTPPAS